MKETVYSADSALRDPSRFLESAKGDLRRSVAVAWQLFRRNLQVRYRRAWLGYAWILLPSIATTIVWVYMESRRIITVTPTEIPYPVHVLAGMALWQTFVDALNAPLAQLSAGRQLITRTRVPQEGLILAGAMETLLNCVARLLMVAILMVACGVPFGSTMMLVPFGVAALLLLGVAGGVLLVPLGLLYEDVNRAVLMVTGLWFFLTPVIYPAPDRGILRFNPVTPLLETTRSWLTSSGNPAAGFGIVTIAALAMLLFGWTVLRIARPHVVARLG